MLDVLHKDSCFLLAYVFDHGVGAHVSLPRVDVLTQVSGRVCVYEATDNGWRWIAFKREDVLLMETQ